MITSGAQKTQHSGSQNPRVNRCHYFLFAPESSFGKQSTLGSIRSTRAQGCISHSEVVMVDHLFIGGIRIQASFHDLELYQWLFLVPVTGGRWHIIPQLAVHTTYIYCLLGGYMLLIPPFMGTISTTIDCRC